VTAPVRILEEWTRPVRIASRPEPDTLPWRTTEPPPTDTGPNPPTLYVRAEIVRRIDARSREGALHRREDMGLLVGDWAMDDEDRVFAVAVALHTGGLEASPVSVRFSQDGLVEVARQLDAREETHVIVGWYHSHLDLGAFMSERDLRTQRGGFPHPHQVAMVVDPIRVEAAAFGNGREGPGTLPVTMASCDEWDP
jgi:proteasome lid subunit RPN8/RPN11